MLGSTPSKAASEDIALKDVAELLLEGVRRSKGITAPIVESKSSTTLETQPITTTSSTPVADSPTPVIEVQPFEAASSIPTAAAPTVERKKRQPKTTAPSSYITPTASPISKTPPTSPSMPT